MELARLKGWLGSRQFLAIVAGVLLAFSFPNAGVAGFAWVAPGLLLFATLGAPPKTAFRIAYIGGLAHYLVSLYWLLNIPYRWLGIPFGPAAGWLALSAYVAIYPGVWAWLMSGLLVKNTGESSGQVSECFKQPLVNEWIQRFAFCLCGAAAWVGLEMIIARLFSGFPWNILGASQYKLTPLIQISTITGVYGVSFLVIWLSLALMMAMLSLVQNPARRSAWIGELIVPMLVVAVLFQWGFRQTRSAEKPGRSLRVTCIQPSIPQTLIWDESRDAERLSELIALTGRALSNRTDLLIWPEAAVPKLLRYDEETFAAVTGIARSNRVWMIIGADDAEPRRDTPDPQDADYYNSSFLISPEGKLVDRYRKRGLVIFGEYIPLERWMPFLKWFTPIQGGFTPGDKPVPFELGDLALTTSVLICFEDIFPGLGREAAKDSDFLVNITNNGWFGEAAAQWQHAAAAVFRAVENRIQLVRCSNNGITCWVDDRGAVREVFRDAKGRVYGPGIFAFELPLARRAEATFYFHHGDVFGWSCVALLVVLAAWRVLRFRADGRRRG